MKNWLIILTCLVIMGCATTPKDKDVFIPKCVKEEPQRYVEQAILRIEYTTLPDSRIKVIGVPKNSPAKKAGIRKGDIIEAVDGYRLKNSYYFKKENGLVPDILLSKEPGDISLITINRAGKKINFPVRLETSYTWQDVYAISCILMEGKNVRLAILTGEINNLLGMNESFALEQWRKGVKSSVIAPVENIYLTVFKQVESFSLVDRQKIKHLLDEFKFGLSGVVSEDLRSKLGEILGATHLLIIDCCRYPESIDTYKDVTTYRLIEIETGKVLASYTIEHSF